MNAPGARSRLSLPHALGFAAVLVLVTWMLGASLGKAWHAPDSDEGYYLYFVSQVQQHGLGVFPELFRSWNANDIVSDVLDRPNWWHPPPYRLGYIVVGAWWARFFGASIASLSWLSTVSHLIWASINWVFARRHLDETFALLLATLCAFSPLLTGEARLALMDNYAVVWVTLAAWLFLEMLEQPTAWCWQIGCGAALTMAILTKELSVFVAAPLGTVALIERFYRQRPLPFWRFFAVLALPGALSLPFFVLAAGGLSSLLTTIQIVLSSPASMPYALLYCSGPWYRYLIDYLCLSAFPTLLGLLGAGALLQRWFDGEWSTIEVFFLVFGVGLLAQQAPFIKNARYMMGLELPLRFLAVGLLLRCAQRIWPARSTLLAALVVAGLCFLDWRSFQHLFADVGGYDPLSFDLLKARKIIPWR
ncbi:MAG TPA: glycosyltransferase family 39 protein, partial [Polyangiaceae bacterium]|nr:glycosyltransferase family 39 protein [Polyangiaceae bacterium]